MIRVFIDTTIDTFLLVGKGEIKKVCKKVNTFLKELVLLLFLEVSILIFVMLCYYKT